MDSTYAHGDLVTFSEGGPRVDAIVVSPPSHRKVVVAIVDPKKGPVFRTVAEDQLAAREKEGAHDAALHSLIRRNPNSFGGGPSAGGGVQGNRGFARTSMHRRAGK